MLSSMREKRVGVARLTKPSRNKTMTWSSWISISSMFPSLSTMSSRWKGLWFGQLEDGTECSVIDLHCFDIPVIQMVRVRFTRQNENNIIDEGKVRAAANYVRRRFPELNREEHPCLYAESRFCRRVVPENEAEQATVVRVHELQSVRIDSLDENNNNKAEVAVHQFIQNHLLPKHPGSFSRLGWRIDVFYKPTSEGDADTENDLVPDESKYHDKTMLAWFVFSMSHSIADGTAMHVVVDDYVQTYMKVLHQRSEQPSIDLLEPRPQLPLISSMPRKHLPFTWWHYCWTSLLGWLVGYILQFIQPQPKLVPNVTENRKKTEDGRPEDEQRTGDGHLINLYARSNYFSFSCVELDPPTTNALCQSARSIKTTVGSMVHAALFVSLAKRYFDEHQTSKSLSIPIPLPVNMRKLMIPELPSTVLAPQQGILSINFSITKRRLQEAVSNESMMTNLLKELAESSRNQVERVLQRQNNSSYKSARRFGALDGPLIAAAMYRCHLSKFHRIKYMGDIAFSNMGLYRPSQSLRAKEDRMVTAKIEATYTFSSPTMANYEFVCCNTTVGGTMTLTMTADPTMGRIDSSCHDILRELRSLLHLWVNKIK